MAVTIYDIAKACDVSAATVSRVLNRAPNETFSSDTQKRVQEKALELGYKTNKLARALTSGKTNQIALCGMVGLCHSLSGCILSHVRDRVNEHDFGLTMIDEKTAMNVSSMDGIVIWDSAEWLDKHIDSFAKDGIKAVGLGGTYNLWQRETDIVLFSPATAILNILNKLVDSGRTKITFLHCFDIPHSENIQDPRLILYRQVMAAHNLEPRYMGFPGGGDRNYIKSCIYEALRNEEMPDAFFCGNDIVAICALSVLVELGVNVPGQTAIVGFDGIEETEYVKVPLTTIKQPYEQGCRLAVDFLCNRIAHPEYPRQYVSLEAELVERESTGC